MSQCIGICQIDEFGDCIGCGRSQAQIDGTDEDDATAPQPLDGAAPAAICPPPAVPAAGR